MPFSSYRLPDNHTHFLWSCRLLATRRVAPRGERVMKTSVHRDNSSQRPLSGLVKENCEYLLGWWVGVKKDKRCFNSWRRQVATEVKWSLATDGCKCWVRVGIGCVLAPVCVCVYMGRNVCPCLGVYVLSACMCLFVYICIDLNMNVSVCVWALVCPCARASSCAPLCMCAGVCVHMHAVCLTHYYKVCFSQLSPSLFLQSLTHLHSYSSLNYVAITLTNRMSTFLLLFSSTNNNQRITRYLNSSLPYIKTTIFSPF